MIESFGYGILLSLAFIGFVSLSYYIVLSFFRIKSTVKVVIHVTNEMTKNEICNLLYGVYIRKLVCNFRMFDEILVINSLKDPAKKVFLNEICDDMCCFTLIHNDEIYSAFDNKGV